MLVNDGLRKIDKFNHQRNLTKLCFVVRTYSFRRLTLKLEQILIEQVYFL